MSATEHEVVRDLLAVVALGAGDDGDVSRVEVHVMTCAVCAEEMEALRATSAFLATSVPQVAPPPDLRRRIMREVTPTQSSRRSSVARRSWLRPMPALAGVLGAAVIGLGAWNVSLQSGQPDDLAVTNTLTNAQAKVQIVNANGGRVAVMRLTNLPRSTAGRGWELWSVRGAKPRSEGFLRVQPDGSAIAVVDVRDAMALALTDEPITNTASPTGDQVVVAPIPA